MTDSAPRHRPGVPAATPGDALVDSQTRETVDGGDATTLTTGRVEAFSDGVIAVAATLLVLNIKEPGSGVGIWHSLGHQFPALAAYVVSFLTILIFWVNHHALYHAVDRVSRAILFVNGLLLLAISFISYSTAVVGHALQDGSNDKSAAALYAVTLGLASLCFTGLWACLLARPALLTSTARPRRIPAFRRSLTGPAAYTAAALLASVSAPASLALDFAVALYFAALPRHLRRAPAGHGEVHS